MKNVIEYIISFLLHGHDDAAKYVGGTTTKW